MANRSVEQASTRLGRAAVAGLSALAVLVGCHAEGGSVRTIDGSRVVAGQVPPPRSSTERFALRPMGPVRGEAGAVEAAPFTWTAPEGWQERPPSTFRTANYVVPGGAECYVTLLGGDAGGARANADRWRAQMGLAPLDDASFAELPRVELLGGEGLLVEAAGAFRGMTGDEVPDALLLGAIGALQGRAVFVKMVGPRASVEPQREAFLAFCRSLREAAE